MFSGGGSTKAYVNLFSRELVKCDCISSACVATPWLKICDRLNAPPNFFWLSCFRNALLKLYCKVETRQAIYAKFFLSIFYINYNVHPVFIYLKKRPCRATLTAAYLRVALLNTKALYSTRRPVREAKGQTCILARICHIY